MESEETAPFGGAAGRVLDEAMSFSSLLSGLFIAFALFVLFMLSGLAEATTLPFLVFQVGMAVVLARYALNGAAGEWNGTLFSTHGGDWWEVLAVAVRYLILNLVWMLPLISMGLSLPADPQAYQTILQEREFGRVFLLAAYMAALALTPPAFLIIALAADGFAGIVTPAVWARTFAGRRANLFAVYATYIGGLCVAALVSLPPILLVASSLPLVALVMLGLTTVFFIGFVPNLLGRLCGFFVLGDPHPERRGATRASSSALTLGVPGPRRPPTRAVPVGPPRSAGMEAAPRPPAAAPAAAVPRRIEPDPAAVAGLAPVATAKRVLLDVRERLEEAWERYATDPQRAIAVVVEMNAASYTPQPLVVHALTLMRAKSGDTAGALAAAREAMPILFERGNLQLAADLYRALQPGSAGLGLTHEQLLAVGVALTEMGDFKNAANTFATVLQADPGERRAVQGMLTVGQRMLLAPSGAADALRLLGYLRQQAPGTPLLPEIERAHRDAERILARR